VLFDRTATPRILADERPRKGTQLLLDFVAFQSWNATHGAKQISGEHVQKKKFKDGQVANEKYNGRPTRR
jgi:hypothetical protein